MKIIQRGILPEERIYTGTCTYCVSHIEATHAELRHTACQLDGDGHVGSCPVCNKSMYFMPKILRRGAL